MRLAITAAAFAALTFLIAACASPEQAAWTYAPPPTEVAASGAPSGEPGSPAPSAEPSVAPSAPASAAPSAPASPAASPAPGGGGTVTVTAANIAFDPTELEVPADVPFTLEFVNNDASVPHDVAIRDQGGTELFKTDVFPGVETRSFDAPALPAGSYTWVCTVHPNMQIAVTAQ